MRNGISALLLAVGHSAEGGRIPEEIPSPVGFPTSPMLDFNHKRSSKTVNVLWWKTPGDFVQIYAVISNPIHSTYDLHDSYIFRGNEISPLFDSAVGEIDPKSIPPQQTRIQKLGDTILKRYRLLLILKTLLK